MNQSFIERRREYRLPFGDKVIFTDGKESVTAYALNISRGGLFVKTLSPFPIQTMTILGFFLPRQEKSICVNAKVAHLVFDKQRCEIDCGMGLTFVDLNESLKNVINNHILNEQRTYQELQKILAVPKPDAHALKESLKKMPSLEGLDLLALRYRVNRICTLFDPAPSSPLVQQLSA